MAPIHEDGYLVWALHARTEQFTSDPMRMSVDELRNTVTNVVTDWHPHLAALFRAADSNSVNAYPFYAAQPVPPWPSSNVTVLGDAIHAMPPTGGVGGSTAIRDAYALADHIGQAAAGETTVPLAVHQYETAMLPAGFAAVKESVRPLGWQRWLARSGTFHIVTKPIAAAQSLIKSRRQ